MSCWCSLRRQRKGSVLISWHLVTISSASSNRALPIDESIDWRHRGGDSEQWVSCSTEKRWLPQAGGEMSAVRPGRRLVLCRALGVWGGPGWTPCGPGLGLAPALQPWRNARRIGSVTAVTNSAALRRGVNLSACGRWLPAG